jgi:S1-C subfamily serine protease
MPRSITKIISLAALVLLSPAALAAEEKPANLKEPLKLLQEALKSAIQEARPSIACILVSRNEAYHKLQPMPTSDYPGQLGGYDRKKLERDFLGLDERQREIKKLDLADPSNVPESYGSGVVISEKGLVLTNYHVVRDAIKIYVRLPGEKVGDKGIGSYADIYAADYRSDLAVLKLLDVKTPLRAIKMGKGEDIYQGQLVFSLANPFAAGFRDGSPSASWGLVSNLRLRSSVLPKEEERNKAILHQYGTLVQTDARLNLGCSGGALLDLNGEMIGLTTATAALSGVETAGGFAVPMDKGMRGIVEVLKRGEEVEYGFLGVTFKEEIRGRTVGVEVNSVSLGSPAFRAKLHARDVILRVNDKDVNEHDDLFLALGNCLAGTEAKLEVKSPSMPVRTVNVMLAKYYVIGKNIAANMPAPVRGLRVDYTSLLVQIVRPFPGAIPHGVMIREIVPQSAAEKVQLRPYEVITHVNGRPVNNPAEFYREAGKVTGTLELTLLIETGSTTRTVRIN